MNALAQTGTPPGGFTPITNPGYVQNDVGTGPPQQTPGAAGYGQPIQTNYNPNLYADTATAQRIAQQLGGTVVQGNPVGMAPGSPFSAPSANMIQLPNGQLIDAGTIAGYEQTYANNPQMLQALINGAITGTGENQSAYQNTFTGYNPAAIAQPGYSTSNLPPGAVLNTGGTPAAIPGGTLGGTPAGTPAGTPPGGTPAGTPAGTPGGTGGVQFAAPTTGDVSLANRGIGGNPLDQTNTLPGLQGGGYPNVGTPTGMPYGAGAIGGYPIKTDAQGNVLPNWQYDPTNNVGAMLQNSLGYAYTQGGELMANYGTLMAQQQQRAGQLGAVGDSMYAFLQANPGYTPAQAQAIMNSGLDANGNPILDANGNPTGLNALNWTQGMANQNFLTGGEQTAWTGDPYAAYNQYTQGQSVPIMDANGNPVLDASGNVQYQSNADYLNQLSRQYGGNLNAIYDTGATGLNTAVGGMNTGLNAAIDPTQLGLSNQFTTNYNWTPADSQNLINAAGRNVGMQTAAIQDQLQRQSAAAGTGAPLALSAALARQAQTGDVASADAMTQAAIQAKQMGLTVQQTLEQMRLASAQDISNRQMQAATTVGQANIGQQENVLAGRAGAALQTGLEGINEQNTIAGVETQTTQAGEMAAQQRAQAMAQNRQQVSQANQAAQFQRGSYTDQAESQRATQEATAARADQTQARQDVRNEEQTAYNESNSGMAGQLQTFAGVTGAGQASQANVIKAAQLPTTLDKVVGAASTALSAEGGIYTKPTKVRVGERGPEITIKLKHMGAGGPMSYRRRNEAAYA
jgi:hypothetical protein